MIDIFTDGSTTNNCRLSKKARGGIGIYFGIKNKMNISEPFYIFPITNQRCEFYACIRAIQSFISNKKNNKKEKIRIITDSKHVIDTMTNWVHKWKLRGWKKADGKEPMNMDLVYWLDALTIQNRDILEITYKHVKAHKNEPVKGTEKHYYWNGNFIADKLANKGRQIGC